MRHAALGVPLLLLAAACSSGTGGTMLGTSPAPKFLDGSIENSVYTAKDGSFSVAVPHKEGSNEYRYMQVKENAQGPEHYVSFGPAATCQTIWRLQVSPIVDPSRTPANFDPAFETLTARTLAELTDAYHAAPAALVSESRDDVHGHRARRRTYTQSVPPGVRFADRECTLTHDVLMLDLGRAVAFVWVQRPDDALPGAGISTLDFATSVTLH